MNIIKTILRALTVSAVLCLAAGAQANTVTNGSFEAGSFSGWTQFGDTSSNGVTCPSVGLPPDGACQAYFGPVGAVGGISQLLSTVAGTTYNISFVLRTDAGDPSSFSFNWDGGAEELLLTNAPATSLLRTFSLVASSDSTAMVFAFRDDTGYTLLDNVIVNAAAVVPVPEPGTLALLGLGLAGLAAIRKRKQA